MDAQYIQDKLDRLKEEKQDSESRCNMPATMLQLKD